MPATELASVIAELGWLKDTGGTAGMDEIMS